MGGYTRHNSHFVKAFIRPHVVLYGSLRVLAFHPCSVLFGHVQESIVDKNMQETQDSNASKKTHMIINELT